MVDAPAAEAAPASDAAPPASELDQARSELVVERAAHAKTKEVLEVLRSKLAAETAALKKEHALAESTGAALENERKLEGDLETRLAAAINSNATLTSCLEQRSGELAERAAEAEGLVRDIAAANEGWAATKAELAKEKAVRAKAEAGITAQAEVIEHLKEDLTAEQKARNDTEADLEAAKAAAEAKETELTGMLELTRATLHDTEAAKVRRGCVAACAKVAHHRTLLKPFWRTCIVAGDQRRIFFCAHPFVQAEREMELAARVDELREAQREVALLTEVRARLADQVSRQKELLAAHEKLLDERRDEILRLLSAVEEEESALGKMDAELRRSFGREMELRRASHFKRTLGMTKATLKAYETPLPRLPAPASPSRGGAGRGGGGGGMGPEDYYGGGALSPGGGRGPSSRGASPSFAPMSPSQRR